MTTTFLVFNLLFMMLYPGPPEDYSGTGAAKLMVITVDDLPLNAQQRSLNHHRVVNEKILHALKEWNIPAIGFVNEAQLYEEGQLQEAKVKLLEDWLEAGMELGNHTYSHPDFNQLSIEAFQKEVIKGEKVCRQLTSARDLPFRYFRHPMLHAGNTPKKKTTLEQFLHRHHYQPAPVTIDNSEWIFARAYENALLERDRGKAEKIGDAYIRYMLNITKHFEEKSIAFFGREIPQVLLLHSNHLNADFLQALLQGLSDRGYRFIALETALEDEAYRSANDYAGPRGLSWIYRWALTAGEGADFMDGEPRTPAFVQEMAGIDE